MKFAVALTLASTAMAGIVARDNDAVEGVIKGINSDLGDVKAAADAYKGDKTDLVKAADKLVSDLKDGKSKVAAGDDLSSDQVVDLTSLVNGKPNGLIASGTALTDSLTSRKSEVEKAGECKTVQDQIAAISTNSKALISTVIDKVKGDSVKQIAQGLADKLTAVLEKAQDSYKDCQDSGNGGGSSSTGGSTPTGTGSSMPTGTESSMPTGTETATQTGGNTATMTTGVTVTTTSCPPGASGTGSVHPTSTHVTVPQGAAAIYAPAGILAAAAAALAL